MQLKAEYEAKPEVQRFLESAQKEKELRKELYTYNLKNPELINGLCEMLMQENVKTFDVSKHESYFNETEEFEKLVDKYLNL